MTEFFDELETREPQAREHDLFAALPEFLAFVVSRSEAWANHLKGIEPGSVRDRAALAALPVLRKSDLLTRQSENPPFGGFATAEPGQYGRIFMSPGPIWEPQGEGPDPWKSARALFAAGFRRGDIVHNAFSYHMTPGGYILDAGAQALGCSVFPAGVGNTELQIDAAARLRPQGYCGTPDFLKIMLDKAEESGADLSSIRKGLVSGAALPASLRAELKGRGIEVLQCYATADLGVIAYESEAQEGMLVNEEFIVEIVRPGTGDPVPEGEVGELVVTSFNRTYPFVRLATGDLSAVMSGQSPCGRTNMRLKGWMGRADQRTKVKGMFIDPAQIGEIAKRHPQLARLRLVVTRENEQDAMVLRAESPASDEGLAKALGETVQAVCKVRGKVELVGPGTLPNDGKVIADERTYS
jgi:phenylacetate-CoA ligase